MDSHNWPEREKRYAVKFEAGRKYIPKLFEGLDIPGNIEQVAVLVYGSKQNHESLGGGKLILAVDVLEDIVKDLRKKRVASKAISEQYPILRTIQFVCEYRKQVIPLLAQNSPGDTDGV